MRNKHILSHSFAHPKIFKDKYQPLTGCDSLFRLSNVKKIYIYIYAYNLKHNFDQELIKKPYYYTLKLLVYFLLIATKKIYSPFLFYS